MSGLDLALGCRRYFGSSQDEVNYGRVRGNPQLYQDDWIRVADSIGSARAGMMRLLCMIREKQLTCHPTKTCFVIYGSQSYINKVRKEAAQDPIMLGDQVTKPSKEEVYLGDVLAEGSSLAASTMATVDKRIARAKGAIREVKSIMEDFRMQAIGGMAGAWDLWKVGISASLLANCNTWVMLEKEAIKKLNDVFHEFLRNIYACPPSTPVPALRSQAGMVSMEYLVWTEKICLVAKLLHRTQPENYARQVLQEQIMMGWEGIAKEARELCSKVGLPDVAKKDIHRNDIKEAMKYHHLANLRDEMKPYRKLDKIKFKDCSKMADYMTEKSLEDSRLEFKWLTGMLDSRVTMSGKYKHSRFPTSCPHCSEGRAVGLAESPDHWMICRAYENLRQGKDPELVQRDRPGYLRAVIAKRKELEKELKLELNNAQ